MSAPLQADQVEPAEPEPAAYLEPETVAYLEQLPEPADPAETNGGRVGGEPRTPPAAPPARRWWRAVDPAAVLAVAVLSVRAGKAVRDLVLAVRDVRAAAAVNRW